MIGTPSRRVVLVGGAAALVGCSRRASPEREIAALEARLGGRVGVVAWEPSTGRRLGHRADERFAMCSTFKAALACHALRQVERGDLGLDERVPFGESDLLEYAPATRARVRDGAMTVRDLCASVVVVSDNTAANLLLRKLGGPSGFTAFLRSIGDTVTRLDRDEPMLNENLDGDPRDTTTPDAMARTIAKLLFTDGALSPSSRELAIGWMTACETGGKRLRAGIPASLRPGDKTGTGARGAHNDVAFARPEGRPVFVVASYLHAPNARAEDLEAAHARIGALAVAFFG